MNFEVIGGAIFNLLFTLASIAYLWGKFTQRVDNQGNDLSRLRSGLYKQNGTLVYVTREECMHTSKDFKKDFNDQIQELKAMITELRSEVVYRNEQYAEELRNLNKSVGGVEQAINMLQVRSANND